MLRGLCATGELLKHSFAVAGDFRGSAEAVAHGVIHDAFDARFLMVEGSELLKLRTVVRVLLGVCVDEVAPPGFRGPADDGLGEDFVVTEVCPVKQLEGLRFVLNCCHAVLCVAIAWTSTGGAHALVGAIRAKWEADLWASATLGAPVADEVTGLRAGGATQSFSRGAIVWSPWTGAQVSKGAIRTAWLKSGAQNGVLGYPTTGELIDLDGRMMQKFQGGQIIWSAKGGAVVFTSTPHSSI
jgi:hypothetical protein